MSAQPKMYLTPEQYLAFERDSEHKHEYYNGRVYVMAGASRSHNLIVSNIIRELGNQLRKRNCTMYPSDLRVKIVQTGRYVYPDITVVCGQERFEDREQDTLLNPTVIIEVLSDSTTQHDRGKKFKDYRTIESFREYLLVSQTEQRIEHFIRQNDGLWGWSDADGASGEIVLPSTDCVLKLADVYEKVSFEEESQELQ